MRGPKVVLIGAGSLFFGRQFIREMANLEGLRNGTAALVDTDPNRLDKMMRLARMAINSAESPLNLEGSENYLDVIKGADFVILSFAKDGVRYRGLDCKVSEQYGVRMCSGDTIGPGGIFRAARELPVILKIAGDVQRICPDAWVINYINPTAVNGLALRKYSGVKSFALCDGRIEHQKKLYLELIGHKDENLDTIDIKTAGVNHFTWLFNATYKGRDILGDLMKGVEERASTEKNEGHSKEKYNFTYAKILWDIFGLYPTNIGHTKEYVPYWQGRGVLDDQPASLSIFDAEGRAKRHDEMWHEVDGYLSGSLEIKEFHKQFEPDHATDIIHAMWTGKRQAFFINTANRGAVGNLPNDAFLELICDMSMDGPVPRPVGNFPTGLRAMQMQVIDTHELTAEAIIKRDKKLLRRAMLSDPIVNSIADADAIINELINEEKQVSNLFA